MLTPLKILRIWSQGKARRIRAREGGDGASDISVEYRRHQSVASVGPRKGLKKKKKGTTKAAPDSLRFALRVSILTQSECLFLSQEEPEPEEPQVEWWPRSLKHRLTFKLSRSVNIAERNVMFFGT